MFMRVIQSQMHSHTNLHEGKQKSFIERKNNMCWCGQGQKYHHIGKILIFAGSLSARQPGLPNSLGLGLGVFSPFGQCILPSSMCHLRQSHCVIIMILLIQDSQIIQTDPLQSCTFLDIASCCLPAWGNVKDPQKMDVVALAIPMEQYKIKLFLKHQFLIVFIFKSHLLKIWDSLSLFSSLPPSLPPSFYLLSVPPLEH